MDGHGSAREAARSATEKPDDEDDEDEDADAAKDGRTSKITEVLEPFCSRGEKVGRGNGGSYKWTCHTHSLVFIGVGSPDIISFMQIYLPLLIQ